MQQLRRLSGRRAARLEEGAYVIEGPVLVAEALDAGVRLQEVLATPEADGDLLDRARAAGVPVRRVRPDALAKAVDAVTSQGVAAIAVRALPSVADVLPDIAAGPLVLVLVDVGDPGNAGTLLRAAEASGATAVLFCGASVDPTNPKCVRASAGSLFHLLVAVGGDTMGVLEQLGEAGVATIGTVPRDAVPYDDVDLRGPIAVVLGSEAHGLPEPVRAAVDLQVSIPMAGRAESLNVAMAGSVLCFEALRQRRGGDR